MVSPGVPEMVPDMVVDIFDMEIDEFGMGFQQEKLGKWMIYGFFLWGLMDMNGVFNGDFGGDFGWDLMRLGLYGKIQDHHRIISNNDHSNNNKLY